MSVPVTVAGYKGTDGSELLADRTVKREPGVEIGGGITFGVIAYLVVLDLRLDKETVFVNPWRRNRYLVPVGNRIEIAENILFDGDRFWGKVEGLVLWGVGSGETWAEIGSEEFLMAEVSVSVHWDTGSLVLVVRAKVGMETVLKETVLLADIEDADAGVGGEFGTDFVNHLGEEECFPGVEFYSGVERHKKTLWGTEGVLPVSFVCPPDAQNLTEDGADVKG